MSDKDDIETVSFKEFEDHENSQSIESNEEVNLDVILDVPVDETHKIQECHIVIYHALCILIENGLNEDFV